MGHSRVQSTSGLAPPEGRDPNRMMIMARSAAAVFSGVVGVCCFLFASEMFGAAAGLVAFKGKFDIREMARCSRSGIPMKLRRDSGRCGVGAGSLRMDEAVWASASAVRGGRMTGWGRGRPYYDRDGQQQEPSEWDGPPEKRVTNARTACGELHVRVPASQIPAESSCSARESVSRTIRPERRRLPRGHQPRRCRQRSV
jgi:hypothetical protein